MERFRKENLITQRSALLQSAMSYQERTRSPSMFVQWPARLTLVKTRKNIKACIGLDYVSAQLSVHLPKSVSELPKRAAMIISLRADPGTPVPCSVPTPTMCAMRALPMPNLRPRSRQSFPSSSAGRR